MSIRFISWAVALVLLAPLPAAADETLTTVTNKGSSLPIWLSFDEHFKEGVYRAKIDISDLRLETLTDQSEMMHRVRLGSAKLCKRVVDINASTVMDPVSSLTSCRRGAFYDAKPQMDSVIQAAGRGERVAYLGMVSPGSAKRAAAP